MDQQCIGSYPAIVTNHGEWLKAERCCEQPSWQGVYDTQSDDGQWGVACDDHKFHLDHAKPFDADNPEIHVSYRHPSANCFVPVDNRHLSLVPDYEDVF